MDLKEKIKALAEHLIADNESLFVVDLTVSTKTGGKVSVLLSGDDGVTIEECASLSRQLGTILEEQEMIEEAYTLEVSSPGVGSPLQHVRQYASNIERRLEIELEGEDKPITGELLAVEDGKITIAKETKIKHKVKTEEIEIELDKIRQAKVLVSFK
ncbi:MAG: ribosome maturation factor RimP [Arenicella sp.]|jgi:ribosome maturation factor RimP